MTACYLARAKWKVPYNVSTAAYVNSLFRPEIVADLRLGAYGFEVLEHNPASFSPFDDGRAGK